MPCDKNGVPKPLSRGLSRAMHKWFGEPCSKANLRSVILPIVGKVVLHKRIARAYEHVFSAIDSAGLGYLIDLEDFRTSGGTYNCRKVRGGSSYSPHAWGVAIDINTDHVQVGSRESKGRLNWHCRPDEVPDSLRRLAPFFERWGFSWGGHWGVKSIDPMHFEATDLTCLLLEGGQLPAAFAEYRRELTPVVAGFPLLKLVELTSAPPGYRLLSDRAYLDTRTGTAYVPSAELARFRFPDLPDDAPVPIRAYFAGLGYRVVYNPDQRKIYVALSTAIHT